MPIGFRIRKRERSVDPQWIKRFCELPVANVSDTMSRMTAGGARLRPMHACGGMVGSALTVKTRPGDNLMIHKAIDMAVAGDVIAVDGGGDLTNSLIGEIMLSLAIKKGVAGFVLDGAIRDADAFVERNLPVYAAGISHRGPYKDGPGEINVPIAIDGMVIEAGDLMLADCDGTLCVPFAEVEKVCIATEAKKAAEAVQLAEIEADIIDRSWVDDRLERLGCELP